MRKLLLVLLPLVLAGCRSKPAPVVVDADTRQFFQPVPARFDSDANPSTPARIALGRTLFYDPRLSKSHTLSCNSCHLLNGYGVDGRPTSTGHKGQKGTRNAPTVYNAGGYVAQFWDGRAPDLEAQALGPITNPVEMAMGSPASVLRTLKSIPGYQTMFAEAFPGEKDPIRFDNIGRAIGAFERGLVTSSRFDRFLAGDEGALNDDEKRGLITFRKTGCTTCHNGAAVGGASFQRLGLAQPYPIQSDLGRYQVTKVEADKMVFKVPSLRNIEKTGPYFHNGSITDLPTVVRTMGRYQLGKELSDADANSIATFLRSMTGELPEDYIAKPPLPPNGPKTPPPDNS